MKFRYFNFLNRIFNFLKACTELNTVQETNGVTDMFPSLPYNDQMRSDYCKKTWNVNIRNDWTSIEFWGRNISTASNIVFSNGVS
jgi:dipeptidyl-peptidase-2